MSDDAQGDAQDQAAVAEPLWVTEYRAAAEAANYWQDDSWITPELRAAAEQSGFWWTTEPNPECQPWCTRSWSGGRGHHPLEFASSGMLLCSRRFAADGGVHVDVDFPIVVDEDAPLAVVLEPPSVTLMSNAEGLSAEDAMLTAGVLRRAAEFCRQVQLARGSGA